MYISSRGIPFSLFRVCRSLTLIGVGDVRLPTDVPMTRGPFKESDTLRGLKQYPFVEGETETTSTLRVSVR